MEVVSVSAGVGEVLGGAAKIASSPSTQPSYEPIRACLQARHRGKSSLIKSNIQIYEKQTEEKYENVNRGRFVYDIIQKHLGAFHIILLRYNS